MSIRTEYPVEEINNQYDPEYNELKSKFQNNEITENQYYEYLAQLNVCYNIDLEDSTN